MSLISEEKRKELRNKTAGELEREGYNSSDVLKTALEEEKFYTLAKNPAKEASKILGLSYNTASKYRSVLTSNNLVKRLRKKPEDLDLIIKRIEERKPGINENYAIKLASCVKMGLDEKVYPIVTDPKLSIEEMAEELEKVGKPYARGTVEGIRSGLINAGFAKRRKKGWPKRKSDDRYFEAVERLGPCTSKDIAEEIKVHKNTANNHIRNLERKGKIKRIKPSVGSRGKKYGQSDLFDGLFSNNEYIVFNPKNPDHLEKITEKIVESMPENMNSGVKKAMTCQLKNMDLPEEVYKRVKDSY